MELIEGLKWRYATKKFDSKKKISSENLEKLKEAVQLSASSYGLQLYKILIIEDPAIRTKLKEAAFGQPQITDASQIFVFCNYTNTGDGDVDKFVKLTADTRSQDVAELQGFAGVMKSTIKGQTKAATEIWTAKQTYIALGTLLAAASELRIDACPMEGFNSQEFNKILNLDEKRLNAAVIATIGYRAEEDEYQHLAKVRKPKDELYEVI